MDMSPGGGGDAGPGGGGWPGGSGEGGEGARCEEPSSLPKDPNPAWGGDINCLNCFNGAAPARSPQIQTQASAGHGAGAGAALRATTPCDIMGAMSSVLKHSFFVCSIIWYQYCSILPMFSQYHQYYLILLPQYYIALFGLQIYSILVVIHGRGTTFWKSFMRPRL